MTKRVDLPESKVLGAVACPKTDVLECNHPFDQSGHVRCHLLFPPLVINERREQVFVFPLWGNMHIYQEPPSGRTSPGALEGGIDVFLSVAVPK
jgi:hypothetical protein